MPSSWAQGDREGSAFPGDQDEHLVLALLFGALCVNFR